MSSYTDAYGYDNQSDPLISSFDIFQNRLKIICIDQMNPKPRAFILHQNAKFIVVVCLTLIVGYLYLFYYSYPMINEIYSKQKYFHQELQIERENIVRLKRKYELLLKNSINQSYSKGISCRRCYWSLVGIDRQQISRIVDNQQHVKQKYDQVLFPLQFILILVCLSNHFLIVVIFERAFPLFLISNFFLLVALGIYSEFFIEDRPNVFYTLTIALFTFIFTISLLFQLLKTFIIIRYYQKIVAHNLVECLFCSIHVTRQCNK